MRKLVRVYRETADRPKGRAADRGPRGRGGERVRGRYTEDGSRAACRSRQPPTPAALRWSLPLPLTGTRADLGWPGISRQAAVVAATTCLVCLLALLSPAGCEDHSYREIGAHINALTKPGGSPVPDAIAQLARIGRRTLPQIETALHTASPHGKTNLIMALDAIGDPEAAPIVQHFAVYDASAEVRAACEDLLQRWAASSDRRAGPARQALARVTEKRAKGEGPE